LSIFFVSAGVVSALFVSCYGWGNTVARFAYGGEPQPASFSVALGCAFYVLIGGVLNATQTIGATTIHALMISGVALALWGLFPIERMLAQLKRMTESPAAWIVLILTVYLTFTLIPTTTFNIGDDFQTYLVYPMRMLQTGAAGVGPGELLGAGTLNAQSFFHAILLLYVPIAFVNAFDPVLCFLAAGLLVDAIGRKTGLDWRYRVIPIVCFVVINPQYVNLSSLYSGSMMVLGLVYASLLLCESAPAGIREMAARALPMALFVSALAVLKMTFLGFVIAYVVLFCLALMALGWRVGRVLAFGSVLVTLTAAFAAPWVFAFISNYIELFGHILARMSAPPATSSAGLGTVQGPMGLFSSGRLFWGGSYIGYLLILIVLATASVALFLRNRGVEKNNRNPDTVVGITVFLAAIVATVLLSYQVRPDLTIRYSVPLLIAIFPLVVALSGSLFPTTTVADGTLRLPAVAGALILGQVLVVGQFADVFADNLAKAFRQRSLIAYPITTQRDFEFTGAAMRKDARDEVRAAQSKVPEGAALFAWLDMPFHLDFARNRILVLDTPGLNVLAKQMDFDDTLTSFEAYLSGQGIRYLIWSKKSHGMKTKERLRSRLNTYLRVSAERNLRLIESMEWMMRNYDKVFDNGSLVVIDIG